MLAEEKQIKIYRGFFFKDQKVYLSKKNVALFLSVIN